MSLLKTSVIWFLRTKDHVSLPLSAKNGLTFVNIKLFSKFFFYSTLSTFIIKYRARANDCTCDDRYRNTLNWDISRSYLYKLVETSVSSFLALNLSTCSWGNWLYQGWANFWLTGAPRVLIFDSGAGPRAHGWTFGVNQDKWHVSQKYILAFATSLAGHIEKPGLYCTTFTSMAAQCLATCLALCYCRL